MNLKNLVIFLISILIFISTPIFSQTATPPVVGDGSVGNPYQITSLENLYWIYADNTRWSQNYIQTSDIDASSTATWGGGTGHTGWEPIGSWAIRFTGSYNGQGFSISGLTLNQYDSGGLFGYMTGATVQNLNVTNVNINNPSYYAAALAAANLDGGTITNCSSSGTVTGSRYPAGLVSWNGAISSITGCFSSANVTATGNGGFWGGGGLVSDNTTGSTIDSCASAGTVNSVGSAGALVGTNSGINSTITNSYSTGNVIGHTDCGGFVGRNGAIINACFSTGNISGGGEDIGAFAGETTPGATTSNCYSMGDVTRNTGSSAVSYGPFAGYGRGTISYCYSIGSVYYTDVADPTDKGFIGTGGGTYDSNFWDSDASNQATATGATAKTTAEMKSHHTFTDLTTAGLTTPWDFATNPNDDVGNNDYWDIDYSVTPTKVRALGKTNGINDNYPFLDFWNGYDEALPVELSSFTVESTLQGVLCKWTTESEIENLGFILERKSAGTGWIEIVSYKINDGLLGQGTTSIPSNYEYTDKLVEPHTTYEYRILDIDYNGKVTRHDIVTITTNNSQISSELKGFTVLPAYPNPFNPSTTITYGLEDNGNVTVSIYNLSGELITTLLNKEQPQGWHTIDWNGTDMHNNLVPAGIYFSRITSDNITKTSKLMLLK